MLVISMSMAFMAVPGESGLALTAILVDNWVSSLRMARMTVPNRSMAVWVLERAQDGRQVWR